MPLLFYFPLIVWMGMMEIAQDEMSRQGQGANVVES